MKVTTWCNSWKGEKKKVSEDKFAKLSLFQHSTIWLIQFFWLRIFTRVQHLFVLFTEYVFLPFLISFSVKNYYLPVTGSGCSGCTSYDLRPETYVPFWFHILQWLHRIQVLLLQEEVKVSPDLCVLVENQKVELLFSFFVMHVIISQMNWNAHRNIKGVNDLFRVVCKHRNSYIPKVMTQRSNVVLVCEASHALQNLLKKNHTQRTKRSSLFTHLLTTKFSSCIISSYF